MEQKTIRAFRDTLRRLERSIELQLRQDTCCHGVTVAQCHALLAIEMMGAPSLGELTITLGLDKSTLSRTVDGLVRSGLLLRSVDEDDRRGIRIALSDKGKKVCDGINRMNDARYERVIEATGREPEELVAVFADLVEAMSAGLMSRESGGNTGIQRRR